MALSFLQSMFGQNTIPEVNYNFLVFVGMDIFGAFQGVQGVGLRHDPLEYHEGGRNFAPRQLPFERPRKPTEVTLRWGTPSWGTLYEWMNDVEVGNSFRREVIIAQLGRSGWPTRLIFLTGAWPTQWRNPDLNASSSEWALEELVLVYDRLNMFLLPVTQILSAAGVGDAGSVTGGILSGG